MPDPTPAPPPYLTSALAGGSACACTPEVTRGFVLWRRPPKAKGKPRSWEKVAAVPTEAQAWALAKGSGDFRVLPADRQP